jgi:general secretion pathway protein M
MKAYLKSPRDQRIAALALLALVVLLAIAAVAVPAWLLHRHYDTHLARMSRQLASYTALNQKRPALMQAVEFLKARDTRKLLLKGATPALASAELQDIANSIVESSGGRVLSRQALATKEDNGYRQVSATLQVSVNIQNLRRMLYAIEGREPYLYVDNLTIRAQTPSGFKPNPGAEPEMFVQLDVSGYAPLPEGARADAKAAGGKT